MIKMMICAPRRDGMTHAEFRRYVTDVHGPLVRSVAEVASEIHHYHYNFPVAGVADEVFGHPLATHLDIITEAWFDSVAAQLRNMEHPRYLQVLRPDEHRFANGATAIMHYTQELTLIDGPRSAFRIFHLRRRRRGLSRESFQEQWLARWSCVINDCGGLGAAVGYIQNHAVKEAEHPHGQDVKYFDIIDEFFVPDAQSFKTLLGKPGLRATVRSMEADLTDVTRTRAFIAEMVANIP